MSQTTLAKIAPELLQRLDEREAAGGHVDRTKFAREFFTQVEQRDEMAAGGLTPGYYTKLRQITERDVLPLYENYARKRQEILARQEKRPVWPFIVGAVVVGELIGAIFSKGRSLRPQLAIPMMFGEAMLGGILYILAQSRDRWRLNAVRQNLMRSVAALDEAALTRREYGLWKEVVGSDDLLRSEATQVIAQYASPEEFWRDYLKVRTLDPITPHTRAEANVPQFDDFLDLHIQGVYAEEARQRRFNQLFVIAEQEFIDKDPAGYVQRQLESLLGHAKSKLKGTKT
jgi:hypothetical protein